MAYLYMYGIKVELCRVYCEKKFVLQITKIWIFIENNEISHLLGDFQ